MKTQQRGSRQLGEFEQLVLLALLRLADQAYGAAIRREIEARTGRSVAIGAVYTALARLERRSYVRARLGDPTPQRGGRRKKYYHLEAAGARALSRSWRAHRSMSLGLEEELSRLTSDPTPGAG